MANNTILLYGRTNSGKTTQLGVLAEHIFTTTGERTRLYTQDRGGYHSIQPYVELGIIDVVEGFDTDPWIFLNQAVNGRVRNESGRWVAGEWDGFGIAAFESMRSFADAMHADLIEKAARGIDIGGGGNVRFEVQGDGEKFTIGGSNKAHYGVVQGRVLKEILRSPATAHQVCALDNGRVEG